MVNHTRTFCRRRLRWVNEALNFVIKALKSQSQETHEFVRLILLAFIRENKNLPKKVILPNWLRLFCVL